VIYVIADSARVGSLTGREAETTQIIQSGAVDVCALAGLRRVVLARGGG
jgi:hypothetical protein